MKNLFKKTLVVLMAMSIVGAFSITSTAENLKQSIGIADEMVLVGEDIEYLGNGLVLVTTIHQQVEPFSNETIYSTNNSTYTKTGSKTQTFRNSLNEVLFSYTVNGTFRVNPGVSASCTSSTASRSINSSAWSLSSSTASRSGNRAMATGVFNRRLLGIVVETRTLNLTLTCNVNGVLS